MSLVKCSVYSKIKTIFDSDIQYTPTGVKFYLSRHYVKQFRSLWLLLILIRTIKYIIVTRLITLETLLIIMLVSYLQLPIQSGREMPEKTS